MQDKKTSHVPRPRKKAAPKSTAGPVVRTIWVHFHIFKNGGSTLDAALQQAYGSAWTQIEGGDPDDAMPWSEAIAILQARPELKVVSSHTLRFPAPETPGFRFLPLFLIRHPIDRLASIYYFLRKDVASRPHEATLAAQNGTLSEFMQVALNPAPEIGSVVCDAQVAMLANSGDYWGLPTAADFMKAKAAVDSVIVPGVVESMDVFLCGLEDTLRPMFPEINLAVPDENRNRKRETSLLGRLRAIRASLPQPLWRELRERNRLDLELWRYTHRLARERILAPSGARARLASFCNRKAAADAAAKVAALALSWTEEQQQAIHEFQAQLAERTRWAFSLEAELAAGRAAFGKVNAEFAERTSWALSLEADLRRARTDFHNQSQLLVERTSWAQSLEADLKKARTDFNNQSQLLAERTSWAQSLQADLQKARADFDNQSQLLAERTTWAQSLEADLATARNHYSRVAAELASITKWAMGLKEDLQVAHQAHATQVALVGEGAARVKSLEVALAVADEAAARCQQEREIEAAQAKSLEADLIGVRQALHLQIEAVSALTTEKDRLENNVSILEQQRELLGSDLAAIKTACAQLAAAVPADFHNGEVALLQKAVATMLGLRQFLAEKDSEIRAISSLRLDTQREIEAATSAVVSLTKSLHDAELNLARYETRWLCRLFASKAAAPTGGNTQS